MLTWAHYFMPRWTIEKFSVEKVLSVHRWTPSALPWLVLRILNLPQVSFRFKGRWRTGCPCLFGGIFDETLEFFSIVVPDGAFTYSIWKSVMSFIWKKFHMAFGALSATFAAWFMVVGNSLAPFLSMLQDFETWSNYLIWFIASVRQMNWHMSIVDCWNVWRRA